MHPSDHPRTRGVYLSQVGDRHFGSGSSPHTRGLPTCVGVAGRRIRIIPAHAGFTVGQPPLGPRAGDHPRTRGVYSTPTSPTPGPTGSSPHTRGLRRRPRIPLRSAGIIPAHAGFTGHPPAHWPGAADHPRTRGVYHSTTSPRPWPPGSSPHTRGLPAGQVGASPRVRIIPAHAGFTRGGPRSPPAPADHPRTRGVYPPRAVSRAAGAGSSPHTRGLPPSTVSTAMITRIIPAHAGFTPPHVVQGDLVVGSSPHTRGLPRGRRCSPRPRRIIPAHAGFTVASAGVRDRRRDHPRTRGVYAHLVVGSTHHRRIIPAHAGFTARALRHCRYIPDHPRTRGVYTWRSLESQRSWSLPPPGFLHC